MHLSSELARSVPERPRRVLPARGPSHTLRVCAIEGGRVIAEKRLEPGKPLTVGTASDNEIVVSGPGMPRVLTLAEVVDRAYVLQLNPELTMELSLGTSQRRVDAVLLAQSQGQSNTLTLSLGSTAKVQLGRIAILFHFVEPLSEPVLPTLPKTLSKRVWGPGDQLFWFAALMCMVIELSGFGYFHTLPRPEPIIENILDGRWGALMRAPPKPKVKPKDSRDAGKAASAPALAAVKAEPKTTRTRKKAMTRAEREAARALVLAKMRTGGVGAALSHVIASRGLSGVDEAFEGVDPRSLPKGGAQGPTSRGGETGEIASIGQLGARSGLVLNTKPTKVRPPRVRLPERGPDALELDGQLDPAEVARMIRKKLPQLQACYTKALKRDDSLAGKILLELTVGETGKVVDAVIEEDSVDSEKVNSCLLTRVRSWRFAVRLDSEAMVGIPLIFQPGED